MKKITISLMLLVIAVGLSSCDTHFWSSFSGGGTWCAYLEVQGYSERDVYPGDYDYMEFTFYTNGTGKVGFYDDYGYWGEYGFYWDDYSTYIDIQYYDGGADRYYYDYYHGYLRLSKQYSMYTYMEFMRR